MMRAWLAWGLVLGLAGMARAADGPPEVPREDIDRIAGAVPAQPAIAPLQARTLLVFSGCKGFYHGSIPWGDVAFTLLGEQTGAYKATVTDDVAQLAPDKLEAYDAVLFNNSTGELFEDPKLRESLLAYVRNGGGVVGIHAATDCFYKWPAYGEMMGGYFDGHPWNEEVTLKIDDPNHPLTAAFGGKPFVVADEIYQFRDPYGRDALRVLLSLDTDRTDMNKQGIKRTDGDFAVSWVRSFGTGRVFYCSLGHRNEIFWNPTVLAHYLAGIQFALGDLPAETVPSAQLQPDPGTEWVPLFNGKDLTGWQGLVGNPITRIDMSPARRAKLQASADERMREYWSVVDGVLRFKGGRDGESICTIKDYRDFEVKLDWRIQAGGDSGIYLRGTPQVQIWDPEQWHVGSGGLYNNQRNPSEPLRTADKPAGEWNHFDIELVGDVVTVYLNGVLVVDHVQMENYWERNRPFYPVGPIELQAHTEPIDFRNIMIRELPDQPTKKTSASAPKAESPNAGEWEPLILDESLSNWQFKPGSWAVEDGVLTRKGGGDIWSKERYGDFVLELEFKLAKDTNSGVFVRTGSIENWLHTSIEVQVLDSFGKEPDKHSCGAVYDCLAPSETVVKPAGEWNKYVITCKGSRIHVVLNDQPIIDMDLDRWTEAHKNPDGSKNKFNTAYKDMPREGHLGLQDHGKEVWYRNLRIKRLD